MRSICLLFALSTALPILLVGCQPDQSTVVEAAQERAPDAEEPETESSPHSTLRPGASGLMPAAVGVFFVMTADQQDALRAAGGAPCSLDVLNGSARGSAETLSLGRADALEAVGWILNARKEVPREFAIVLEGDAAAYILKGIAGGPRPDVAQIYSSESATSAGYRAGAALVDVAPGTYAVHLAQDTYNALTRCETGWVVQVTE